MYASVRRQIIHFWVETAAAAAACDDASQTTEVSGK